MSVIRSIEVIDSHTEGEPTRTVVGGFPDLGGGTVESQLDVLRLSHDAYRRAVINEPRGHDVLVGALLCPSSRPDCLTGVIFFNNTGYLRMCGHGMIGVIATLRHLGRLEGLEGGRCRVETPVGVVEAVAGAGGEVELTNVDSWRAAKDVVVEVPGRGVVRGDVAWGGNWFFLVKGAAGPLELAKAGRLAEQAAAIRREVNADGYPQVDHIEFFGPPVDPANDSRNFVLCPGGEYDRSPCGTGTSAKLACLAADGALEEGALWRQEGILGTSFHARYEWVDRERGTIRPRIAGRAYIVAESRLLQEADDPFAWGLGDGAAKPA